VYSDICTISGRPRFEPAKKGGCTLKVDGVYVESRFNPDEESRQLYENLRARESKFFIFLGSGLGYHINLLLGDERAGGVLVEQSRDIFMASLFIIRPDVLSRLVPFVGTDTDRLSGEISVLLKEDSIVVPHRRSMQGRERYYSRVSAIIKNHIRGIAASRLTGERSKKIWLKNVLRNCTSNRRAIYSSENLRSLFRGPAVLVASGPFLEEADDRLRELGEKLPVISLLPSVSYLMHRGVRPDFVISTDAGFWNRYRLFSALTSMHTECSSPSLSSEAGASVVKPTVESMPLIAALSVDSPVIRLWPGDVYVISHGLPIEMRLKKTASSLLVIPMQGTAAIVMILIARTMGFSPLYLAGFDFALQGLKSHHRGAGFDELLDAWAFRLETRQTFAVERLRREFPAAATDSAGNRIYTTHKLRLYKNWLEQELHLEDMIRLNRGLPVSGIKEDTTPENYFNGRSEGAKEGLRQGDAPAEKRRGFDALQRDALQRNAQQSEAPNRETLNKEALKQECGRRLSQGVKQELDQKFYDLEKIKKKVFGYMKAYRSGAATAPMIYRFFYGEIPAGLTAEELERESLEAMQEFNRTV